MSRTHFHQPWVTSCCTISAGDPHMTGFLGQKFDFTGEDGGWYSLIADANMHINMRVTSPVPDLPEITYITGTYDTYSNVQEHGSECF